MYNCVGTYQFKGRKSSKNKSRENRKHDVKGKQVGVV